MEGTAFVQPIAIHSDMSSYLIVRDTDDNWFIWLGDDDNGLTKIPEATAEWMRCRPEIEDIPLPRFWFDTSSLPLSDSPQPSRSI